MKRNNLYKSFFPALLLLVGAFAGCSKDDGPIKKEVLDDIDAVPAITTTIDPAGSQSIDLTNLSSFQGKFSVALYFEGAKPPEKIDVVVRKTNASGTNIKVYKADVTTLPATYTVTAEEIENLFGEIQVGDNYDFSADIYNNGGKKYEAFPAGGIGTGSGPNGMPGYSAFARFGAICAYDPDIYEGQFVVETDEWADYSPGDVITVEQVSANQFSFKLGAPDALPIIVTVNTNNNVTSVAKQVYSPDGYGIGYGALSCQTVDGSPDNFVAPCDQEFSVRLVHTVSAGSFGDYVFKARKKN